MDPEINDALLAAIRALGPEPFGVEAVRKVLALLVPEAVPLMPAPARAFLLGEGAAQDARAFVEIVSWFPAAVEEGGAELESWATMWRRSRRRGSRRPRAPKPNVHQPLPRVSAKGEAQGDEPEQDPEEGLGPPQHDGVSLDMEPGGAHEGVREHEDAGKEGNDCVTPGDAHGRNHEHGQACAHAERWKHDGPGGDRAFRLADAPCDHARGTSEGTRWQRRRS
jgi:hypothetical protein